MICHRLADPEEETLRKPACGVIPSSRLRYIPRLHIVWQMPYLSARKVTTKIQITTFDE